MSDTTDITTEQTKSDIKTDTITTKSDTETTNDEQVNTDSPTGYDGEKEYNEYSGEETDSEDTNDEDTDDNDTDKTVADYRRELYTQQIEVKVLMNTYDKSDSMMKSIISEFNKYKSLYNSYSDDIKKELKKEYDRFVSEYNKWYVENTVSKGIYKSTALLISSSVSCCLLSIVCAIVIIVLSKRH